MDLNPPFGHTWVFVREVRELHRTIHNNWQTHEATLKEMQMGNSTGARAPLEHMEIESESDEAYDEKFIDQQLNATVFDDFKQALYEVRYVAPILALLGIVLAYHLTIAPYRTRTLDDSGLPQVTDLVSRLNH